MKETSSLGMNKTGIKTSPLLAKQMVTGMEEFRKMPLDESITATEFRQAYIGESGEAATVPAPVTAKGAVSTGVQMFKGNDPRILLDKLGERIAFERTGVRLYDALITKCELLDSEETVSRLRAFREEEAHHFEIVRDAMEKIGGDSTAMTPCANTAGVAAMGLLQVICDPRTTVAQCVQAILIAELTDNDGWDMLIQLVDEAGLTEQVKQFQIAKDNEDTHLEFMREWLKELTLKKDAEAKQDRH